MPVKSLMELCIEMCQRNVKEINNVGNLPYPVVRRILRRVQNADQLRLIEEYSPQIAGDDAECWVSLIERDFRLLSQKMQLVPSQPEKWYRVYKKYQKIDQENKLEAQKRLVQGFKKLKAEGEDRTATVVNFDKTKLPRPPREGKLWGTPARRGGRRVGIDDTSGLRFTLGSRTKTNSARSVLQKARREAKEITMRNRLATPTGSLAVRLGQISKAPTAMVEAHRVKSQPKFFNHTPQARDATLLEKKREREQKEREDRLRRMKLGQNPQGTVVSDSESDVDDAEDDYALDDTRYGGGGLNEEDLEDVFSEEQESTSPPKRSSSYAPASSSRGRSSAAISTPPKPQSRGTMSQSSNSRGTLLSNMRATPDDRVRRVPVSGNTSSSSQTRNATTSNNNKNTPQSTTRTATSPTLQPQAGASRKRKPTDVFMAPKKKTPRPL